MNTTPAQPQPPKGLFAFLLAIPFVRAAFQVLRPARKPRPRQPIPSCDHKTLESEILDSDVLDSDVLDSDVFDEKAFHNTLAVIAKEIIKLLEILDAHRAAARAPLQARRTHRKPNRPLPPAREGRGERPATDRAPARHALDLPASHPRHRPKDRGSG